MAPTYREPSSPASLGDTLQALRHVRKLTQVQVDRLAWSRCQTSLRALGHLECGRRVPTPHQLDALFCVYELSPSERTQLLEQVRALRPERFEGLEGASAWESWLSTRIPVPHRARVLGSPG